MRFALSCLVLLTLVACSREAVVVTGPGVLAPQAPRQQSISGVALAREGFELTPRADFEMTAKLLSKRRYRWDELAAVAPWDFALAWGALSDEALLSGTKVMQGDRLMYWHLYDAPVSRALAERSSANVHLIPETAELAERLAEAPRGAIVTLRGTLVDLRLPDRRVIPTSLTRYDRGVGACEILLLREFSWSTEPVPARTKKPGRARLSNVLP